MVRGNRLLPRPDEPLTGQKTSAMVVVLAAIFLADAVFAFSYSGGHPHKVTAAAHPGRKAHSTTTGVAGAGPSTSEGELVLTPSTPPPGSGPRSGAAAPAAGPSGKLYPVTQDQPIRSGPSQSGAVLGTIPNGTTVGVQCKANGDVVSGPFGSDPFWDKVIFGNALGYISDEYVDTKGDEKNDTLVPPC